MPDLRAVLPGLAAPLLLLAAAALSACGPAPTQRTVGGGAAAAPIPVALLVPHAADGDREAKLAEDMELAARMAVNDLDGVSLELRVYGTSGRTSSARQKALQAVADGARIIIGPLHAESANAAAVAAARRGVNVLAFTNNTTIAGGNLFVLGQTFESSAQRVVAYAVSQGKSRILTIHSDNLSGRLAKRAIDRAIAASGATQAGSVGYGVSRESVVEAVDGIRAAVEEGEPDAIFLTATTAEALPLLTQILPETGLDGAAYQYLGLARWDASQRALELAGLQGGWFPTPDPQGVSRFARRFRTIHKRAPHILAGLAYDAVAAAGALAKTGVAKPFSRRMLTQPRGFAGVNGVFRLMPGGTNERALAVATVADGRVKVISPAPRKF